MGPEFKIGQRVIYVGRARNMAYRAHYWNQWKRRWGVIMPKLQEVYTVRDTRSAKDGTQRLRVVEIVNPIVEFNDAPAQESWFYSDMFRPLVERKTDISIFEKMLTPRRIETIS